jgi:hypothetical protein
VLPDPIPPRYTFDEESSSDEDQGHNVDHKLSDYQDIDDEASRHSKKKVQLEAVSVSLTEDIGDSSAVVVGVEFLSAIDAWFGHFSQVGTFSIGAVVTFCKNSLTRRTRTTVLSTFLYATTPPAQSTPSQSLPNPPKPPKTTSQSNSSQPSTQPTS